ncbi:TVP38/TMEM64 family protein [Alteribacter keqinensis]|uniref:TVP38/TMEM64 family membrane protein n=1 Tax=Alteribacter keqinensis TaxID=2483800 RepID=A0A3M7TXE5_9BACI|nr:VTT domain-containing protein [Alteribacter keqinensis]RNA69444.1 TVP38/TMEM64 family protein [Alteribacter keqinensis]
MKKWLILAVLLGLFTVAWQSDWVSAARSNNVEYFIDTLFEDMGYGLLLVTIPLMIIQNVITLFPVVLIILVHIMAFGVFEGGLYSLAGTVLGAWVCFLLVKYFNFNWTERIWNKRKSSLSRYYRWIKEYGVFTIVALRSIPVFPSNLISFAAAFTPISLKAYIWSCVVGNLSMIWLLSLLTAPLWLESNDAFYTTFLSGYVLFALTVAGFYLRKAFYGKRGKPSFEKYIS